VLNKLLCAYILPVCASSSKTQSYKTAYDDGRRFGEYPKAGFKAEWRKEARNDFQKRFPKIKAAVFWNERRQNKDESYSNPSGKFFTQSLDNIA
jgi:hypothetical protein